MTDKINGNYQLEYFDVNGNKSSPKTEKNININFNFTEKTLEEKSLSEIMGFEKSTNDVPKRQINPNDKRPDVDDYMWDWMYGQFTSPENGTNIDNIKRNRSITTFNLTSEVTSVGNSGEININKKQGSVTVWKGKDTTSIKIISNNPQKNSDNQTTSVKEYVVDNKSGKLLSEGNYLNGKGIRYNFSEDGTVTKEQVENNLISY